MQKANQPIAIIGMACRFPKIDSINELWSALCRRMNTADVVPADRWDADRYFSSDEVSKGKAYIRRGGFVKQDPKVFDASFFGISPREAENMDPQQRLMLEVVWEAFENCGLVVSEHAGKNVGVYVGGFMLDHMITQMAFANRSQINQHTAAGMMMTMLSNRISHTYDFRGPSLSIDTACSSSLVAFNYGCQDIWRGSADVAVVGGVNVMMRPEYPMGMCKGHFLSRDGESKSFDSRGDGYGRGEGAGAVLLKPLAKAIADGDTILSTVIGTGTNQDGHTPGISMPNGESQEALIEEVCNTYQIDPAKVDYVECHGTGTAIGDPTECGAIGRTYGKGRDKSNPVVIGSIKSNVGHMEAAAGVAGVIKAVLTIMHRKATPLGNLQEPNDEIAFDDLGLRLSDEMIPLGTNGQPITVAVNSFGYGGSNAHALLQSPPTSAAGTISQSNGHSNGAILPASYPKAVPVSGRSTAAMAANAQLLADHMEQTRESIDDIVYTLSARREHFNHRAVVLGEHREDIVSRLREVASGKEHDWVVKDSQPFQGKRLPVLVFTGMGPQSWFMGQQLYKTSDLYREHAGRADAAFQSVSGFSILAEMLKSEEESQITKTIYAQPANLLLQIGICEMLRDYGVTPGAVVGHSVGELGSAYAAGVLSLQDAMTVSYHRSQLQATTAGSGGMLAVGLSKQEALDRVADCPKLLSIAAINGSSSVTLAGYIPSLERLASELTREGVFNRMLDVEIPYHSPLMDPLMGKLRDALQAVETNEPTLPLYSTVTGAQVHEKSFGADYWPLNIRNAVEFETAIHTILNDGYATFLEVGPHPVLSSSLKDCFNTVGKDCRLIHTLRRNLPDELQCVQRAAAHVYAAGCDIDWARHAKSKSFVQLPNYAWQRERFWVENDRAMQDRINPIINPILGTQECLSAPVWRNDFDHENVNYLRDHVVKGVPILPAAGYLESLLELCRVHYGENSGYAVRDVEIAAPMIINAERGLDFTTSFDSATSHAVIRSLENGRLGTGSIHLHADVHVVKHTSDHKLDFRELLQTFEGETDVAAFYSSLATVGLNYGPLFQTVRKLHLRDGRVMAKLEIDESLEHDLSKYLMHPTMLDGCFQTLIGMLDSSDTTYLPTHIEELCVYVQQAPRTMWCVGERVSETANSVTCDLKLIDETGRLIGVVRGLRATAAARGERIDKWGDKVKRQILNYQWSHGETLDEPKRLGHWMFVGDAGETSEYAARRLDSFGGRVVADVRFGDSPQQNATEYTIRHDEIEDAESVLSSCGDLDGVVFFGGLDERLHCPSGQNAANALLVLTQALLKMAPEKRPRVYVVTSGAFCVDEYDKVADPRSATLNGYVRVAANELEQFKFSTVDLPAEEPSDDELESLVLELICDASEDEVAIRSDSRMTSELLETGCLTDDRIKPTVLNDSHPILLRAKRSDVEGVGTIRVLMTEPKRPSPGQVLVRVEYSLMPTNLIEDQSSNVIEQGCTEIVGTVLEVGDSVNDLQVGMQICGFGPADLASHLCVKRSDLSVVAIDDDDIDGARLVSGIALPTRAICAVTTAQPVPGDTALVLDCPLGRLIASELAQQGVAITMLADDDVETDADFATYRANVESIELAVTQRTLGRRFSFVVGDIAKWASEYGFRALGEGGCLIDTSAEVTSFRLPRHAGAIVRTAISSVMARPRKLAETLSLVTKRLNSGELQAPATLQVSVYDLAWQQLQIRDATNQVVINYDIGDKDLPVVQNDEFTFDASATYLITGGFGGFGFKTARWLLQNGAKNLVLTGRLGANTAQKKAQVAELESMGGRIYAAACDTADMVGLDVLFAEISDNMPTLKGIFHSGAVIEDQAISDADLATFNKVMQSKALGAWNLHVLTEKYPVDHFVMYSSLANLIGNSRQSAYSAANGYLNGLVRMRRANGLSGTSVNWGAIDDVGVVAQDEKLEQFLRHIGLRGIPSGESLELLRIALARDVAQFGVLILRSWADWARFETIGSQSPRFASLISADSEAADNGLRDELVSELAALAAADQVGLMSTLICQIVASVLKADPENVSIDRPVNELGIDSLMAAEVQVQFETQLGLAISVLELIGDTTIRSLASKMIDSLQDEIDNAGASTKATENPADEISQNPELTTAS